MLVLLMNYFSSQLFEIVRRFFDFLHFYKQHKAEIGNKKKKKKRKARDKQQPEAELLLFENYTLSSSMLPSKTTLRYSKKYCKRKV